MGPRLLPPALQSPSNTFPALRITPTTMKGAATERQEKLWYQDRDRVPHV